MKTTILFIILLNHLSLFCQNKDTFDEINNVLELNIDSIEIKVTHHKKSTDTTLILHYSIRNNSKNEISFITNSCPSYNTYIIESIESSNLKIDYRNSLDIRPPLLDSNSENKLNT